MYIPNFARFLDNIQLGSAIFCCDALPVCPIDSFKEYVLADHSEWPQVITATVTFPCKINSLLYLFDILFFFL